MFLRGFLSLACRSTLLLIKAYLRLVINRPTSALLPRMSLQRAWGRDMKSRAALGNPASQQETG